MNDQVSMFDLMGLDEIDAMGDHKFYDMDLQQVADIIGLSCHVQFKLNPNDPKEYICKIGKHELQLELSTWFVRGKEGIPCILVGYDHGGKGCDSLVEAVEYFKKCIAKDNI
jgi:hypothetical protein